MMIDHSLFSDMRSKVTVHNLGNLGNLGNFTTEVVRITGLTS